MTNLTHLTSAMAQRPAPLADEVRRMLDAAPPRPPIYAGSPEDARREQDRRANLRPKGPDIAAVWDEVIAGPGGPLTLRVYRPTNTPPGIILYFHGGGWVIGNIEDSDAHVRRIAASTGCVLISVDYRLAPEHPFPAAVNDAIAAWRWVLAHRAALAPAGTPLAIGGESAGGNIAAGATIALRDSGFEMPAFQILGYPVTSSAMDTPSYRDQAAGPVLSAKDMAWFWSQYAPDPAVRRDPRLSPIDADDLRDLPPAFILTAECDPLCDEGEAYAAKLAAAGVPVRCKRYPGMIHGFYKMADVLDGGRRALTDVAAFVRDQTHVAIDRDPDSESGTIALTSASD